MDNTQQQLDPSITALTKAIGHQESGGDYNKIGDNGHSVGAYQWNNPTPLQKGQIPKNFSLYASDVGADPNDFSPTNQDRVAYKTVEKWGKSGLNPAQISSKWNSGGADNYKTATPGYNAEQGVNYDVKSYVNNVSKYYDQYNKPQTQQQGYNPTPYSNPSNGNPKPDNSVANLPNNPPPVDTLGSELKNRGTEAVQGINSIVGGKAGTGQTRVSGLVQTAGAVAGALGDVVNKGLELIPGVKQIENLLGQGIGALAKTSAGQSVMKSVQDFSTTHPELAKDIGAAFNIVTAIPILRGLGVVGKLGMEAGSQALKETVIKGFTKDLETSGGKIAQRAFNPSVVDTSIKYGVAPEIKAIEGRTITDTTLAQKTLEKEVSRIDDEIYQPALKGLDLKFPIEGVKTVANDIAIENLSDPSAVNRILDRVAAKYGLTPTLEQLNMAKRDITRKIKVNGFADPDLSNNRIARMALQKAVEQNSMQFGVTFSGKTADVINKEMGDILKTLTFYEKIDGMSVKQNLTHQVIKGLSTATGAGIGTMLGGNTLLGGAIGYGSSGLVEGQLSKVLPRSLRAGMIKRTGANAVKVSKQEMLKKLPGLFAGSVNVK